MIKRKEWKEFQDSGLLWFINTTLHLFGWAIVFDVEDEEILEVYPARVEFRGFPEEVNDEGYAKVSSHMQKNIASITKENMM
jgi:hypothetical protein